MAISDIFSTSFLFSIAIIIILIGGIFAYVSYRMSEQDHKLTSMVNLVSILAQDLQFVKTKLHNIQHKNDSTESTLEYSSQLISGGNNSDLIDVSDEESVDEDNNSTEVYSDEEINSEDENEDEYEDEEEEEDEDDEEDDEEEIGETKVIKLQIFPEEGKEDDTYEKAQNLDFDVNKNIENFETDYKTTDIHDIKILDMIYHTPANEDIQLEETNIALDDLKSSEDFKSISINDLGDIEDLKPDYKKMSLNKLREVVVSKGVVADASKLKKNEILKMLGDE